MQQTTTKQPGTTRWSVQQQEFAIERALFWAGYFSLLMAFILCRQIAIHWLQAPELAFWLEAPQVLLSLYMVYRIVRQPSLMFYKSMTELKADGRANWEANFPDEYLRDAFLQASNKGYQSGMGVVVLGAMLTLTHSKWLATLSQWFPGAILLPLAGMAGTGAFFLSLRAQVQDETTQDEDPSAN